jgi:hypothetical protein
MFLLILVISSITFGQNLKILKPKIWGSNNYSKSQQLIWQDVLDKNEKIIAGQLDYSKLSKKDKDLIDDLEMGSGPLTQGPGCSWYCGGEMYKVTSNSCLPRQGTVNYIPDNIHDFNLFTAWAPDTIGGVIGKKINFHFKPLSPRVNKIIIYDGYLKNYELFKSNSRVKTFKLYVNGNPYALLELKDTTASQTFSITPLQSKIKNKDLILTFEIIDIYKGSKYSEVAVSEINFDGLDVHCFGEGTKILMADNSLKNIEFIQKGDKVKTYNYRTKKLVVTEVKYKIKTLHSGLNKLIFENCEIVSTDDHPFWVENKGWGSLSPVKSNTDYKQTSEVQKLEIGDKVFVPAENKFVRFNNIEKIAGKQITYTIDLKKGDNFVANGLLVKTEKTK